jgi:hypothetical protein
MQAIEHIIALEKAETIEAMDAERMAAHEAVDSLHLQRLKDLERQLSHRLGTYSALQNVGMSPATEGPRRRPIRDSPQA